MDPILQKEAGIPGEASFCSAKKVEYQSITPTFSLADSEIRVIVARVGRKERINPEDLCDFVNECWIAIQAAKSDFKGGCEKGYVRGIARYQALNVKRAYVYEAKLKAGLGSQALVTEQVSVPSLENVLAMESILSKLDAKEREILRSRYLEGRTLQEASSLIGLPYRRTYAIFRGALAKLRHVFGDKVSSNDKGNGRPKRRLRGLYLILPVIFLAAITSFAMNFHGLWEAIARSLLEGMGCFLRDAPFEFVDLSEGNLPCERRDRAHMRHGLYLNEHRSLSGDFFTLLEGFFRGDKNNATIQFGDRLTSLELDASIAYGLYAGMQSANSAFNYPPLKNGETPWADPLSLPGGGTPQDPRTNLVLERLAIDYCAEDNGWELGCDKEELMVVWILIGSDYFACGMSPLLTGVTREAPFEAGMDMPAHIEMGQPPQELHVFSTVLDLDTGGPEVPQMLNGLAVTLTASYVLYHDAFAVMDRPEIDRFRDFFLFALRMVSGEHDYSVFSHRELEQDASTGVVVEHWPDGSYFLELRFEP